MKWLGKLIVMAAFVLACAMPWGGASASDQKLLLEVVINGHSSGKIGEFTERDGALLARPDELIDVGLKVPESVSRFPDGLVAVSSLPGVTARLDMPTQSLLVEVRPGGLVAAELRTDPDSSNDVHVESGTGATLNYDLAEDFGSGHSVASGSFDMRFFSPYGVVSSSALAFAGGNSLPGNGEYSAVRLDSAYTYSDFDNLRRYTAGDFINAGLSWSRPVRLGGVQIGHDFSMRPDLVTFPLPSLEGTTAVPSTVGVLVNGTQILSQDVQPGPFQVPQLPVVNGAGTVSMTVTNALGQQVSTTLPFYASTDLLAPDLQTFSIETGFVRRDWGIVSDDYGDLAGSATYRDGISPNVTFETHAEGTSGQFMGGAGLVANAFDLGVVNLAVAASTASGNTGEQISIGAQRIGPIFSFGVSAQFATHDFRDIAAMNGDPVPLRQISASAGVNLPRWGSFGVAYADVDREALQLPAEHAKIMSANYSVQVGRFSLFAAAFRDFAKHGGNGLSFGVTVPLGSRTSSSAEAVAESGTTSGQFQAQQSAISPGDWGYQAYASVGNTNHEFAQAQYLAPWALVSAGVDQLDNHTSFRGEAQGSLSVLDGGFFPSDFIHDSFAVADTSGVEGIHVLNENRDAGTTDSGGRLLLPYLRSYDINRISIDPLDVPVDSSIPYAAREVRPADRSGVVVGFPVRVTHGALLVLVDKYGKPLPLGSAAVLAATHKSVPVGYDGQTYVEDLDSQNALTVEYPDGHRCTVGFAYRAATGEIPKIGPLTCEDASR